MTEKDKYWYCMPTMWIDFVEVVNVRALKNSVLLFKDSMTDFAIWIYGHLTSPLHLQSWKYMSASDEYIYLSCAPCAYQYRLIKDVGGCALILILKFSKIRGMTSIEIVVHDGLEPF